MVRGRLSPWPRGRDRQARGQHLRRRRSGDWLKFKCGHEQELVIGGFTRRRGARPTSGALLVGFYEGVGCATRARSAPGSTRTSLHLGAAWRALEPRCVAVCDVPVPARHDWVQPELVAEFGFAEWTRDGRLRHPRYLGLRDDKPAREVVRERPA